MRFDLENEKTIRNYRTRVLQAEAANRHGREHSRNPIQEQEHLIDLATALGEDVRTFATPVTPGPALSRDRVCRLIQSTSWGSSSSTRVRAE